jgi:hypothetical protein
MEVLAAMAEAHQASIAAMMDCTPLIPQATGAIALSKDVLIERAQVAALKLQGTLKAGKKT